MSLRTTVRSLVGILDGFYAELASVNELGCGHNGAPLTLADNVVFVVSGDTPKNSFTAAGWPDGSAGNLLYVRSNGWLTPGWFGDVLSASTKTNFNPTTGALDPAATNEASLAAAVNGLLYAIARGSAPAVSAFNTSPYAGVVAAPAP